MRKDIRLPGPPDPTHAASTNSQYAVPCMLTFKGFQTKENYGVMPDRSTEKGPGSPSALSAGEIPDSSRGGSQKSPKVYRVWVWAEV